MAGAGIGLLHTCHADGCDQHGADLFMHRFMLANPSSGVAFQPKLIMVCPQLFDLSVNAVDAILQRAKSVSEFSVKTSLSQMVTQRWFPLKGIACFLLVAFYSLKVVD